MPSIIRIKRRQLGLSEEEYSAYDLECRQWVAAIVALRRRFKNMVVIVDERRST